LDDLTKDGLLSDDELDAILSAYTAYCEGIGIAVKIDGTDGVIYLPGKRKNHSIYEYFSEQVIYLNIHRLVNPFKIIS